MQVSTKLQVPTRLPPHGVAPQVAPPRVPPAPPPALPLCPPAPVLSPVPLLQPTPTSRMDRASAHAFVTMRSPENRNEPASPPRRKKVNPHPNPPNPLP